ncbi:MAG TPA: patatin-like phospholipase family protein [Candidatus Acidoferrales bacterium]|nr:patatin-like phospholipase family protein [Candidatus Acidoferrales bacterium]
MKKLNVREFFRGGLRRIREFAHGAPAEPLRPPRIGLALGGGFARGIAHLGVLRVLEHEGIHADCLSGTSVGGMIAAAYASGAPLEAISRRAVSTSFRDFARWSLSRFGLATNDRLGRYVYEFCGVERIEQMKRPLAICAADLLSGEPYYFTKGDLGIALRASCAYPGLFQPVEFDGRLLVDGFLTGPVPVEAVRTLGAEFVIGVYLGMTGPAPRPKHMGEVLWRSFAIMQQQAIQRRDRAADVLISPDVRDFAWDDFSRTGDLIAAGEAAAHAALPRIRELLEPPATSPARERSAARLA